MKYIPLNPQVFKYFKEAAEHEREHIEDLVNYFDQNNNQRKHQKQPMRRLTWAWKTGRRKK